MSCVLEKCLLALSSNLVLHTLKIYTRKLRLVLYEFLWSGVALIMFILSTYDIAVYQHVLSVSLAIQILLFKPVQLQPLWCTCVCIICCSNTKSPTALQGNRHSEGNSTTTVLQGPLNTQSLNDITFWQMLATKANKRKDLSLKPRHVWLMRGLVGLRGTYSKTDAASTVAPPVLAHASALMSLCL